MLKLLLLNSILGIQENMLFYSGIAKYDRTWVQLVGTFHVQPGCWHITFALVKKEILESYGVPYQKEKKKKGIIWREFHQVM